MYTAAVPTERPSRESASVASLAGAAAIFWGRQRFAEYVTADSNVSGTFILILIVGGFLLSLAGLVAWCRRSDKSQRRKLSGILLVFGALTFCVALPGHVLGTFFAVAIPSLLLGIVVRLLPGTRTT
jgi:hypothetical protein